LESWREGDESGGSEGAEIGEAVLALSLCLARAIHAIDPSAVRDMNFQAGLEFNAFVNADKPMAADLLLRFGRALLDKKTFPEPDEPPGD
jgi:hypothetical protein